MKIIDGLMWLMFIVSSVFSILTMIVTFGMVEYSRQLRAFTNFLPLEISLSLTLFLWGINSLYNSYSKNGKKIFFRYFLMGVILLVFIFMGVY